MSKNGGPPESIVPLQEPTPLVDFGRPGFCRRALESWGLSFGAAAQHFFQVSF